MNKLGFGFLRLKMDHGQVDQDTLNAMVDAYLAGGGTYFDTAYTYLDGKSELAVGDSLVRRHPRDSYILSTKLPGYSCKTKADCWKIFREQLQRCQVHYFDIYMLHWLNREHYAMAQAGDQFAFLRELKAQGLTKRIGFSYHDTAELLDEILTAHPEVDCVLLQINYLDWESDGIQSRKCYETAVKHGKSVFVMEPVKGGSLAQVPEEAEQLLKQIDPEASPAALAIRFAQSLPGVERVFSGMNSMAQMEENLRDAEPLTEEELALLQQAAQIIKRAIAVPCTGCGYCVSHCPQNIPIPQYFKLYNENALLPRHSWKLQPVYETASQGRGKGSDCIGCRACEAACPQKLPIPEHMAKVAEVFEK